MIPTVNFWIFLLVSIASINCGNKNKNEAKQKQNGSEPLVRTGKVGWVPPGTEVETEAGVMRFKPPDGWAYIGYDDKEGVVFGSEGPSTSLHCSCEDFTPNKPGSDSKPTGLAFGCKDAKCQEYYQLEVQDRHFLTSQGGYFRPQGVIRLVKAGEEIPAVFDALFLELPDFKEQLSRYLARAHYGTPMALPVKNKDGSLTPPAGYALIALSVMGRGLVTVVPKEYAVSQPGYVPISGVKCEGSQCSGGMVNYSILGTAGIWCKGTCSLIGHTDKDGINPIRIRSYTY